jgi:hypothetical protein
MTIPQGESVGVTLPPRVERIVAPDARHPSPAAIAELDEQDLAVLRQIALRAIALPEGWMTGRAISALAQRDPSAETALILSRVVGNRAELLPNRQLAAARLAQVDPQAAEQELIKRLDVDEPPVRAEIIKSLGSIGRPSALAALDAVQGDLAAHVARQLAFAKALIAYRHNLDRDDLLFPVGATREPGTPDQMIDLTLRNLKADALPPLLGRFSGNRYGLDLSDRLGFELDARRAHWVLYMNRQLEEAGLIASLARRKYITGLLSLHEPRTNTYSPQYVVLTNPKGGEIAISVVRTDGEVFYTGKAGLSRGVLNFQVQDVERPGTAPTNVAGKLTARGIRFSLRIPFGQRTNQKRPVPLNH